MKYIVYQDDNLRALNAVGRFLVGEFDTPQAALECCRQRVDSYLHLRYRLGMSASQLYDAYTVTGPDLTIRAQRDRPVFDAWEYARNRCEEIARGGCVGAAA